MSMVLSVCWKNVARSQIFEALYPDPVHEAISAGIDPGIHDGRTLVEIGAFGVIMCMAQLGYHIERKRTKKLKRRWIEKSDKIVVMVQREFWPGYLKEAESKIEYWNIPDPAGASLHKYIEVRDIIRCLIYDDKDGLANRLAVNLDYN